MGDKTVIIFDQLDAEIKFIVLDGDHRKFNSVYVNQEGSVQERNFMKMIYDKDGNLKVETHQQFPVDEVKAGAHVIVAGFLP